MAKDVKEMKGKSLLRREFFKQSGIIAGGVGLGAAGFSLVSHAEEQQQAKVPEWPWPYATLDVEEVRKRAHLFYYKAGCMYATFGALITSLADKVGYPYTTIPIDMARYGSGGVIGWGSVCGTLNGSSAVITLVVGKEYSKVVNELLAWYTETPFPSDISNEYAKNHEFLVEKYKTDKVLPQTVSRSTLCHVSVNTWCKATEHASKSPERAERCGRMSADVAAKTVELLNQYALGKFVPTVAAKASECSECHFMGENYEAGQFIIGKERNCVDCHGDPHK